MMQTIYHFFETIYKKLEEDFNQTRIKIHYIASVLKDKKYNIQGLKFYNSAFDMDNLEKISKICQ